VELVFAGDQLLDAVLFLEAVEADCAYFVRVFANEELLHGGVFNDFPLSRVGNPHRDGSGAVGSKQLVTDIGRNEGKQV